MKGLIQLIIVVIATAIGLALLTEYQPGSLDSETVILGLPVVSIAQTDAQGWLAMGQVATGVVVIAQGGGGLVTFAQGGVGLLFGIGQGMVGLAAIAQVGVGFFFFMGQVGGGAQAIGQGVFVRRPKEYFKEMSADFNALLSFRSPS